jgi:hypothetical protein
MSNSSDAWQSLEVFLDWDTDECPTVERPVPLELIRSTDRERWADSCPTMRMQVPPELVAESVPPPNRTPEGEGEVQCAALPAQKRRATSATAAIQAMPPAMVLSIAFLVSAVLTSTFAIIIRYALGL